MQKGETPPRPAAPLGQVLQSVISSFYKAVCADKVSLFILKTVLSILYLTSL